MKPSSYAANHLEEELRRTRPSSAPPPDLHRAILQAVRSAHIAPAPQADRLPWRWVMTPALAILVGAAVWIWWPRPAGTTTAWMTAGVALERAQAVPRQASAVALAPLSKELELLNRDVRNTVDYLVASMP